MPQIVPGGPVPAQPEQSQEDLQIQPEEQIGVEGNQGVSEEQRQELLDMIGAIREKLSSYSASKFAGDSNLESLRSNLLQQVFEKLQLAGVDLTDQQSVASFMERLKQTSPELAANFEKAMEVLLGGSGMPGMPQDLNESMDLGIPPQNMNNENENGQTIQGIPQG